jgi:hypothetical protein
VWGADRIGYQLTRDEVVPVPGRTSIYRALVRNGLVVPGQRRRRRSDYRRWERGRPMELWQTSDRAKGQAAASIWAGKALVSL